MKDMKRAFGSPDPEFHERVRQTLFRIEEKEQARIRLKNRLKFVPAVAFALCFCIIAISIFSAAGMLQKKKDVVFQPLAQNNNPGGAQTDGTAPAGTTPDPTESRMQLNASPTVTVSPTLTETPPPHEAAVTIRPADTAENTLPPSASIFTESIGPAAENREVYPDAKDPWIFYHLDASCSMASPETPLYLSEAWYGGLQPCPDCVGDPDRNYVISEYSAYYHDSSVCFGNAVATVSACTLDYALLAGDRPCQCVTWGTDTLDIIMLCRADLTGSTFYYRPGGEHYHLESVCEYEEYPNTARGAEAYALGLSPCPACLKDPVFYYLDSAEYAPTEYYHQDLSCFSPDDAPLSSGSESILISMGKLACPVCMSGSLRYTSNADAHYHMNGQCASIFGRDSMFTAALSALEAAGKTACPQCIQRDYYISEGEDCFHSHPYCCLNPKRVSVVSFPEAEALGLTACEKCINPAELPPFSVVPNPYATCFWTSEDLLFHTDSACSGMKNPFTGSLADAVFAGKKPCPACLSDVWLISEDSAFFHIPLSGGCFGLSAAVQADAETVANLQKTACPVCVEPTLFFASAQDPLYLFFHTRPDCAEMTEEQSYPGTVLQALDLQKRVCPSCSDGLFYCTEGGTYYHSYETCSGMSARLAEPVTIETALALGKAACPACITGHRSITDTETAADSFSSSESQ